MYTKLKEKIEKTMINSTEKQKIINSLKNEEHEYLSFFVCRNPVEKLLSIFDMKSEQFQGFVRRGTAKNHTTFYTWTDILSTWSQGWR